MVGVGRRFHGFTVDVVQNEVVLCHISQLGWKTNFLNSHGAGYRYFKDSSAVDADIACCVKAAAITNKNNNNK